MNARMAWLCLVMMLLMPQAVWGITYPLPPAGTDVVGHIQRIPASEQDTLISLGRDYGVGYEEIRRANPGIDVWLPGEGTEIVIPSRFVLPNAPRDGVVINVSEMRLYYFPPRQDGERAQVETYPISVGRMDWGTPIGQSRITEKTENPYWYPPQSILTERAAQGRPLPDAVPPGPDNPLGNHKMRLSIPGGAYLIHGTNEPRGIGMRVTHGCIRMFPEDVESLFARLPVGTPVHIVNQPVKAGWLGGEMMIEAHPILPPEAENAFDPMRPPTLEEAVLAIAQVVENGPGRIDHERLADVVEAATGMPAGVSRAPMGQRLGGDAHRPAVFQP